MLFKNPVIVWRNACALDHVRILVELLRKGNSKILEVVIYSYLR